MPILDTQLIAALLTAVAALSPASPPPAEEQDGISVQEERERDRKRPRDEIFVKSYPIQDITGFQRRFRLEQIATSRGRSDAERLSALKQLQDLSASRSVETSTEEVQDLIRRMMNPSFDEARQNLVARGGKNLIVSGNQLQHNSVRLLLRELRSEDRFIKVVVSVYELPPAPLPASIATPGGQSQRTLRRSYFDWLQDRVRALGKPTYQRTVAGEIGRPIHMELTRRVPVVVDYRKRSLVDSDEIVFEPVIEEILEGPVIDVLVGRFQKLQLVVEAGINYQSCRRPIPTRTIQVENAPDLVVQAPEVDDVSGRSKIHTGFEGPSVWLATVSPIPTESRTDYYVSLKVERN